jgi:hypothetical protein
MFKAWQGGSSSTTICSLCEGLSFKGNDDYEKFIAHADRDYVYTRTAHSLRQSKLPIFSMMQAECFDQASGTHSLQVVRIIAILEFRHMNKVEIICILAPMEKCLSAIKPIPFDLYQYQSNKEDHLYQEITCCHASMLRLPVFHIAKGPTETHNYVNNVQFAKSNKKRQQFYVITIDRCRLRVGEGRSYEEYYSSRNKKLSNKKESGWQCFYTPSEIINFRVANTS